MQKKETNWRTQEKRRREENGAGEKITVEKEGIRERVATKRTAWKEEKIRKKETIGKKRTAGKKGTVGKEGTSGKEWKVEKEIKLWKIWKKMHRK